MTDIDSWLLFCRTQKMKVDVHNTYGEDAECICAKLLDYDDTHNSNKETPHA